MKGWHMVVCLALVALAAILIATGASAVALVPAIACVLMMGAMILMMSGHGGRGS